MTNQTSPDPAALWARSVQTAMEAWAALTGTGTSGGDQPADPFQLWRRAFDQWLDGWSAFYERTLTTPETAAMAGRTLDTMLNIEKPLRENTAELMQDWLEFFNLPSRRDWLRLAAQLNDANARLDDLQELIENLTDRIAEMTAEGRRMTVGEKT
jgi:hypothetical protein